MKFFSRIILVYFIFFQFSSSVLFLINSDKGNKFSVNIIDEDQDSKEIEKNKELKFEFAYINTENFVFFINETTSKVSKRYLLNEYSVFRTQFIPPPELV